MLDCPLHEEILPNVQCKHPVGQHETIPSCPIIRHQRKRDQQPPFCDLLPGVVESSEVFPHLLNVQIKQLQFPHWLLITLVF